MKQKLFNIMAVLALVLSVFFVAARPTIAADTSVPFGDEIVFVDEEDCNRVFMGIENDADYEGGLPAEKFYIRFMSATSETSPCSNMALGGELTWAYRWHESASDVEKTDAEFVWYDGGGDQTGLNLGGMWYGTSGFIEDLETEYKFNTRSSDTIVMFEDPVVVISNGDYENDFNWTEMDLSSTIPSDATSVFIRLIATCDTNAAGSYISFSGEGDLASTGLTLRAKNTNGMYEEAQSIVKTNEADPQSIYWKVWGDDMWTNVYVVVIGYARR